MGVLSRAWRVVRQGERTRLDCLVSRTSLIRSGALRLLLELGERGAELGQLLLNLAAAKSLVPELEIDGATALKPTARLLASCRISAPRRGNPVIQTPG
jgi:hypothetical protein